MNFLLDTNILVFLSKNRQPQPLNQIINRDTDRLFLSVVTIGELRSIALQNNWSSRKWATLDDVITRASLIEINESLVTTYTQIDAFSQRKNPLYIDYPFTTPRNMGKNDLWIASTAALLGLTLVTTDADFDHLHNTFLEVRRISPDLFR